MADKSEKQAQLLEDLRKLPVAAAAQALLALYRARQLRDDILTRLIGPGAPALLAQTYSGLGDLAFELARLQVKQIETVLKFSQQHSEQLFQGWRKIIRKPQTTLELAG